MRAVSFVLALTLAACGGATPKAAGEECVASSECADGLVCDLGRTPAVCAGSLTAVVDAPPAPVDAAEADAAAIDAPAIDARVIDAPAIDAPAIDADIDAAGTM